jgi:hypothetical protein
VQFTSSSDGLRCGRVEPEPILDLGPLGAFDDSGVTPSCLVRHNDCLYLYYTGWSLGVSVPFYLFAGLAISDDDGATFKRLSPSPILERDPVDHYLTASPFVLVEGARWRMWYVSATGWSARGGEAVHRYHVRYAESEDGISWRRDGRVCIDFADEEETAMGRPFVLRESGRYRMWFAARGKTYRLAYAESTNGLDWQRDDQALLSPSDAGWDAEMSAYPWVVDHGDRRFLLYTGNGYGRAGIGYAVSKTQKYP